MEMKSSRLISWGLFAALPLACGGRMLDAPRGSDSGGSSATSAAGTRARGDDEDLPALGIGGATPGGVATRGGAPQMGGRATGGAAAGGGAAGGVGGNSASGAGGVAGAECAGVGCSTIDLDCKPGMHVGRLPDECCPLCVPDKPEPCEVGRAMYEDFRAKLIVKVTELGCGPDTRGCALFGESNRCSHTCGTPIPAEGRDNIEEELGNFAAEHCTQCPKELPLGCPIAALQPFSCVQDSCQYTPAP